MHVYTYQDQNYLQIFCYENLRQERRFARKAVLFLATVSADAQEEKFWKHKAKSPRNGGLSGK